MPGAAKAKDTLRKGSLKILGLLRGLVTWRSMLPMVVQRPVRTTIASTSSSELSSFHTCNTDTASGSQSHCLSLHLAPKSTPRPLTPTSELHKCTSKACPTQATSGYQYQYVDLRAILIVHLQQSTTVYAKALLVTHWSVLTTEASTLYLELTSIHIRLGVIPRKMDGLYEKAIQLVLKAMTSIWQSCLICISIAHPMHVSSARVTQMRKVCTSETICMSKRSYGSLMMP